MTKRIFRAIMTTAAAVLIASLVIMTGFLYSYFGGVQENQLRDELELAAAGVERSGEEYLKSLGAERYRLTLVAASGEVLFDTESDAADMENHAEREEIGEALKIGEGASERYSSTLLEKTVYRAKRLSDGSVLRISVSRATAGSLALGMLQPFVIVLLAALALSGALASGISKRIVEPLNELNLDKPLENDAYEELAPLLGRLNRQQRDIASQLAQLSRRRDEFAQITESMKEALVLLDDKGFVVSINPTACRLFGADGSCVGRDFLTVERSREVSRAVALAMADGHSETRIERAGREYQLDVSRIESGGDAVGAVLLAFDVTEREHSERNRREFTANVSHELKTPLQSIIGSAELIENGMVKSEDMPRFVGHIRQEASRLVALIEDIIRLSQLDEGGELPFEEVDLLGLAGEVAADLSGAAEAKNVSLAVSGESAVMSGVRRLLYETVYNLADNAIKYNVDGGSVNIAVSQDKGSAKVTVSDTGLGIPEEHQSRVFERFYRVDKSHSKLSGGTGLGLSIVKHAVGYHHGEIELRSRPGEGSQISAIFPKRTP